MNSIEKKDKKENIENDDFEKDTDQDENNESGTNEGPFDYDKINIDISTINIGYLIEQLEYNEIELSPEFQRSVVWDDIKKSKLIESVLLGLPLPSFYFSEDPATNKLVIVDGLQRICAFKSFMLDKEKPLKLKGMEFLTNLEGKTYNDLDRTLIRRLKGLKITLNTLKKDTPTEVKYVLFKRVNTAGVPLTAQEMRNALYQGKATKLLNRMVEADSFKNATGGINPKRMLDRDFANRFIAFYHRKTEKYNGKLEAFMGDALDDINKMDDNEISKVYVAFDTSMSVCFQLLGNKAFRRPDPKKNEEFLKNNKSIFEALSVSIAKLNEQDHKELISKKDLFKEEWYKLLQNEEFVLSVTSGTAKAPQVEKRFSKVQELIKKVIGNDQQIPTEEF